MKHTVVALPYEEKFIPTFERLKGSAFLEAEKTTLLHVFPTKIIPMEMTTYTYPSEEEIPGIRESVLTYLTMMKNKLFGDREESRVQLECRFSTNPKKDVVDFLGKNKADCVIVATRGLSGFQNLFSSSFADFMIKHAPCDVHVLRSPHFD